MRKNITLQLDGGTQVGARPTSSAQDDFLKCRTIQLIPFWTPHCSYRMLTPWPPHVMALVRGHIIEGNEG